MYTFSMVGRHLNHAKWSICRRYTSKSSIFADSITSRVQNFNFMVAISRKIYINFVPKRNFADLENHFR